MSGKPQLVSETSVSSPASEKPKGGPAYRIRTVRGYRRMLDWATRRMLTGHLSKDDLVAITSAAKAGAELMMTENILARVGQDQELDNILGWQHPTAARRMKELVQSGRVRKTPHTSPTGSGRQATVYVAE